MDLVTLFAAHTLTFGTPHGPAHQDRIVHVASNPIDQWKPLIAEASQRFRIRAAWIRAVMRAESAGRTMTNGHPTTSRAGAIGLMQVMPETYAEMRPRLGLGADPYDPDDNILAGTAFLRMMYDHFGYPGLFAAYNAGPERYEAWRRQARRCRWRHSVTSTPSALTSPKTCLRWVRQPMLAALVGCVRLLRPNLNSHPGRRCFSRSEMAQMPPPRPRNISP
jgi:hypothetical protein